MNETKITAAELIIGDRIILGSKTLEVWDIRLDESCGKITVQFIDSSSKEYQETDSLFIVDDIGDDMEKFTHRSRGQMES